MVRVLREGASNPSVYAGCRLPRRGGSDMYFRRKSTRRRLYMGKKPEPMLLKAPARLTLRRLGIGKRVPNVPPADGPSGTAMGARLSGRSNASRRGRPTPFSLARL